MPTITMFMERTPLWFDGSPSPRLSARHGSGRGVPCQMTKATELIRDDGGDASDRPLRHAVCAPLQSPAPTRPGPFPAAGRFRTMGSAPNRASRRQQDHDQCPVQQSGRKSAASHRYIRLATATARGRGVKYRIGWSKSQEREIEKIHFDLAPVDVWAECRTDGR